MIILLDTSSSVCKLVLLDGENRHESEWDAHRELAKDLLGYIETQLQAQQKNFEDIRAIGVFRGPGSFTGLRIGITVLNTLADALPVPIVGETGEDWQKNVIDRIKNGENEQIVLPFYGSDAHITSPRK